VQWSVVPSPVDAKNMPVKVCGAVPVAKFAAIAIGDLRVC